MTNDTVPVSCKNGTLSPTSSTMGTVGAGGIPGNTLVTRLTMVLFPPGTKG